jgi:membrane-associated phospholipid phosphatase
MSHPSSLPGSSAVVAFRSSTFSVISTQNVADDSVPLGKSNFTPFANLIALERFLALVAPAASVYVAMKDKTVLGVASMVRIIVLTLALLSLTASPAAAKSEKDWATVSDIGAYGLAAVAVGFPVLDKDKNGALQAVGSLGATSLLTTGLKEAFPELRPDGSNRKSFPSGHTAMAFTAAASLYNRQGASVGIPAFAVAALVGVARVQADKHFWYDAVVGAGIGAGVGFLITHQKPESKSAFIPWGDTKGGGVTIAMRF